MVPSLSPRRVGPGIVAGTGVSSSANLPWYGCFAQSSPQKKGACGQVMSALWGTEAGAAAEVDSKAVEDEMLERHFENIFALNNSTSANATFFT